MSSTLDPDADEGKDREILKGHGTAALGPSDTSDSGSDVAGISGAMDSDTDSAGTGERQTAEGGLQERTNNDIRPDHVTSNPDADESET